MENLLNMISIEMRKAWRSRIPLFTLLGFMMLPLACAFLMFVYKDPEFARSLGILSVKAELAAGSADWPFYLGMFAQGLAVAGILLFSLVISWVFGREFADGTLKDLLAVPVARSTILLAKFIVVSLWSLGIIAVVYGVGLLLGGLIGLDLWSEELLLQGSLTVAVTACLVIAVVYPIAFLASAGRGYLLPMGIALMLLILANVVAVVGWGGLFPWSIPGMYAGFTGSSAALEPVSYWIVACTALAGIAATHLWWQHADQSR